jgi:hypothetical protein
VGVKLKVALVHEHDPMGVVGSETLAILVAHLPPCLFHVFCTTAAYA